MSYIACARAGAGPSSNVPNKQTNTDCFDSALPSPQTAQNKDMLTRLPRTVAFSTRQGMATYRKAREPYNLKKKPPARLSGPSFFPNKPRNYAPEESTSFGLRPPTKEPWKADDDRFDTSKAREVEKPIGGEARQHLVVRSSKKDGSSPSTPTQTLESLIPRGKPLRFSSDDHGNFPISRQRLPDGTYEGQSPCIFLGNVPFELLIDKRDMWKRFEGFGEIRDIRIRKYYSSFPRGCFFFF